MTERGAGRLARGPDALRVGNSSLAWSDGALVLDLDEVTAPWPSRVRGRVRLRTEAWHSRTYPLDAAARHLWQPIAPCATVEVDLERPRSRWRGNGYFDCNRGSAPLEADFVRWQWARGHADSGSTSVLYDVVRRDGSELGLALAFANDGDVAMPIAGPPPLRRLPRSGWGLERAMRSDAGTPVGIARTLEDGPFYARSLVRSSLHGATVRSVHESLDLDRFASPWVQAMLPFRMPRRR